MIVIIKHVDIEGPGSIEEFFSNTAWDLKTVNLNSGGLLPDEFDDIEAIISLGGPMNVYEVDKYPFLKDEDEFLKKAVKQKVPILGICLGAQLLAKACGAKIRKATQKEVGWHKVSLTQEGKIDQLLTHSPLYLNVFQWHEDTFDIPESAVLLAESAVCKNQLFRFGPNAYGMQFHIEVTPAMVELWVNEYLKEHPLGAEADNILIDTYKIKEEYVRQANLIYLNFTRIIDLGAKTARV